MDIIALRYNQRVQRYPDEDEEERWNGVALDFYIRTGDVPREVLHYKALASARRLALKYRDDQPRVPAGNPGGGQWTADGGSGGSDDAEEVGGGGGSDEDDPAQVLPAAYRPKARYSARRGRMLQNYSKHPNKREYDEAKDPFFKDGDLIGKPGTTPHIRTMSREDYIKLKDEILKDSFPVKIEGTYEGKVYERRDGTFFGIRQNERHGESIDILESPNETIFPGTKVHQK